MNRHREATKPATKRRHTLTAGKFLNATTTASCIERAKPASRQAFPRSNLDASISPQENGPFAEFGNAGFA
jgi:hypothetical protein